MIVLRTAVDGHHGEKGSMHGAPGRAKSKGKKKGGGSGKVKLSKDAQAMKTKLMSKPRGRKRPKGTVRKSDMAARMKAMKKFAKTEGARKVPRRRAKDPGGFIRSGER